MTDHGHNDIGRRWRIVGFGSGVKVVPRDEQSADGAGGVPPAGVQATPVMPADGDGAEPSRAATA